MIRKEKEEKGREVKAKKSCLSLTLSSYITKTISFLSPLLSRISLSLSLPFLPLPAPRLSLRYTYIYIRILGAPHHPRFRSFALLYFSFCLLATRACVYMYIPTHTHTHTYFRRFVIFLFRFSLSLCVRVRMSLLRNDGIFHPGSNGKLLFFFSLASKSCVFRDITNKILRVKIEVLPYYTSKII